MNSHKLKIISSYLFLYVMLQHTHFTAIALKCRMEEDPSEDELRKVIHTCVRRVIGNQSQENAYSNARADGNGDKTTNNFASNGNNQQSWTSSNSNNKNNARSNGFDNEDYDRIRNRELLQIRVGHHKLRLKRNSQTYFDSNADSYGKANANSNSHDYRQQQQYPQQQQQQRQTPYANNGNHENHNNQQQYDNGMAADYSGGSSHHNDRNIDGNYNNNRNNNNHNMNHAHGDVGSYGGYDNNNGNSGQNGQNDYNYNRNYRLNNTNKISDRQSEMQKQHEGACIIHCFFGELKMLNNEDYPDKRKVVQVLTRDVKNNDLREFYRESVKECFHLIEVERHRKDKCEFAKTLINCMTDYAQANCDDWDDSTIIF